MILKTLKRAGIGFLLGIVVGNVIAHLTGGFGSNALIPVSDILLDRVGSNVLTAQAVQTLLSGVYGAICFAGISFYEIDRWPLALATAAHFLSMVLIYMPGALFLGWVEGLDSLLIMLCIQIVVFFIIWLIMWLIYKAQVKELNELNDKLHEGIGEKQPSDHTDSGGDKTA